MKLLENMLECPFCGGSNIKVITMDRIAHVECEDCGGRGPAIVNDDFTPAELITSAISGWNTAFGNRKVARAWELPED